MINTDGYFADCMAICAEAYFEENLKHHRVTVDALIVVACDILEND